jgi:hypothetical protein
MNWTVAASIVSETGLNKLTHQEMSLNQRARKIAFRAERASNRVSARHARYGQKLLHGPTGISEKFRDREIISIILPNFHPSVAFTARLYIARALCCLQHVNVCALFSCSPEVC